VTPLEFLSNPSLPFFLGGLKQYSQFSSFSAFVFFLCEPVAIVSPLPDRLNPLHFPVNLIRTFQFTSVISRALVPPPFFFLTYTHGVLYPVYLRFARSSHHFFPFLSAFPFPPLELREFAVWAFIPPIFSWKSLLRRPASIPAARRCSLSLIFPHRGEVSLTPFAGELSRASCADALSRLDAGFSLPRDLCVVHFPFPAAFSAYSCGRKVPERFFGPFAFLPVFFLPFSLHPHCHRRSF